MQSLELLLKEGEGLCVEFKEKFTPKISQDIVGFANAKGGIILLGVNDRGIVVGETLSNNLKSQILDLGRNCKPSISLTIEKFSSGVFGVKVPEGSEKPYVCSDGFFKRYDGVTQKLSPQEVREIFKNSTIINFESIPREDCNLDDLSVLKINNFLKRTRANIVMNKKNIIDFLDSIKLYSNKHINNAALLMFAKNIESHVYHSQIFLVAYKGTEGIQIYDKKYVRNDLLTQYQEALLFCEKHLNVRSEFEKGKRKDLYEIPLNALRESIANAIIHRDYSMSGTNIQLEIHQDRVVISNPGGLVEGITLKKLGTKSFRRNELIADMFSRMNLAERFGSGIRRVKTLLHENNCEPPLYESDSFFKVTLKRPIEFSALINSPATTPSIEIKSKINDKRQQGQKRVVQKKDSLQKNTAELIIKILKRYPQSSQKELANLVNLTLDGVKYHIKNLQKQKRIKRIGSRKAGSWKVIKAYK